MVAEAQTPQDASTHNGPVKFETTAWEMVIKARVAQDSSPKSSLGLLIERYWRPVYCFIRQFGNEHELAKDLAQDFFTDFIERDIVTYASKSRGKFRTFLLASVKRYLALQHRRKNQNPPVVNIPDLNILEQTASFSPMQGEAPDSAFDKNWAKCMLENATARLFEECKALGKDVRFKVFERRFLVDGNNFASYRDIATLLGISETAVRKHLEWTKKAMARLIREEVVNSIGAGQNPDTEIRELMSAL